MDGHSSMGSKPCDDDAAIWDDTAKFSNDLLRQMREILHWRQGYLQLIKKHLTDFHKRLTTNDELVVLSYTQELHSLVSTVAAKETWLSRMFTPPWEERSLGWRKVLVDDETWDLLKMNSWKVINLA